MPVKYFTYGAAASEVELDCLTGAFTVLRTDVVMDVGHSLNPALDIGQIEGAFVQVSFAACGYGLWYARSEDPACTGTPVCPVAGQGCRFWLEPAAE